MNDMFHNQSGIIDPAILEKTTFGIIGVGAIGSFYAMTLAKMGAKRITIYDPDKVEEHNVANQFYPLYCVGDAKVEALKELIEQYSGPGIVTPIEARCSRPDGFDVIVIAVDDITTRTNIWDAINNDEDELCRYFIDARMGAQVYRVLAIDMAEQAEVDYYKATLHPKDESVPAPCTQKSIIYTVLEVAGCMLALTKQLLCNDKHPIEVMHDMAHHQFLANHLPKKREAVTIGVQDGVAVDAEVPW